ncbi:MAG: hypothetical protein ACRDKW_15820 [Actinomycetota bacterium]
MRGDVGWRAAGVAGTGAVALAYGWLATASEPFTWHVRVSTAVPGIVVAALAIRRGWFRLDFDDERPVVPRHDGTLLGGVAVWAVLAGAAASFQLAVFFSHPRSVYPTLSSLMNIVFAAHGVRAAGFAAWIGLAFYFLRR